VNIEIGKDIRLTPQYIIAKETFHNWRYETPVRLAFMAMVPIEVSLCVLKDYYAHA